ncbi:MAG: DUF2135 domain-containing protein, partial [Ferruginibacter sp.]
ERRNVDPGLLEKTEGNNFRTRIYPIPAKGCRTVLIGYEQELTMTNKSALLYSLPLHFKEPIETFDIAFKIYSTNAPEIGSDCSTGLKFSELKNVYTTETKKNDFTPDGSFSIVIPKFTDASEVLMQQVNGQYYFLINSFPEAKKTEKNIPDYFTILWDVSLSGLSRDHQKEMELLGRYFSKKQNASVRLATIGYDFTDYGIYKVDAGNWAQLKTKIEHFGYDGATDFTKIKFQPSGEYLFFTDGLNTYSDITHMNWPSVPVSTINASPNGDYPLLRFIAAETGGSFINLNEFPLDIAAEQLASQQLQFIGIKNISGISESYPSIPTAITGSCAVAGISNTASGTVTLQFGYGKKLILEKIIQLDFSKQSTSTIDLAKLWAQKKINELELQYELNRDQVTDLGKKYGLITKNSSLIVLDAVEDYVKYDITPPAELLGEYTRLIKLKVQKEKLLDKRSIDGSIQYYNQLANWWERKFPLKRFKYKDTDADGTYDSFASDATVANSSAISNYSVSANASPRPGLVADEAMQQATVHVQTSAVPFLRVDRDARSAGMMEKTKSDNTMDAVVPGIITLYDSATVSDISINTIVPERKYLKQLDSISKEKLYEKYLSIRTDYLQDPVFFFDMANRLFANGDTAKGLRVLSNIADLNFDDHELYKMLGYRLKALHQYETAVFVYKKVLQWRPQEPQSYRDYALALQDAGKYQQALDTLYLSLTKNFDEEISSLYPGIEEIITTEINNLVAEHPGLNLSKIDQRIIKNLPVDVRVVLNWNMNDTDIDLWVFDPNNEKYFYSHTLTAIGGRISHDFTRGYGPEQFMLKKALTGKYKVMLNYYGDTQQKIAGPTTVMAQIFTNYGKPNQQSKTIALQMQPNGRNEVMVGEFSF